MMTRSGQDGRPSLGGPLSNRGQNDKGMAAPMTAGRQRGAFTVASLISVTLLVLALSAGLAEFTTHGPAFFAFRHGGTGSTPGHSTDELFLASQQRQQVDHAVIRLGERRVRF